jgi:hypothetical protein
MVDVDLIETLCDNVSEVIDTLKMMDDDTFDVSRGAKYYENLQRWCDSLCQISDYYRQMQ